jgi:hypothetical protein
MILVQRHITVTANRTWTTTFWETRNEKNELLVVMAVVESLVICVKVACGSESGWLEEDSLPPFSGGTQQMTSRSLSPQRQASRGRGCGVRRELTSTPVRELKSACPQLIGSTIKSRTTGCELPRHPSSQARQHDLLIQGVLLTLTSSSRLIRP